MEQFWFQIFTSTFIPEAVAQRCSVEKVWPAILLKRGSGAGVCEYAKFLRTPFFIEHLERLLFYSVNCSIQFRGCVTNGVIESDVKEVIKKQLDNPLKRKDDGKTQITQIIGLIRPMLIYLFPAQSYR